MSLLGINYIEYSIPSILFQINMLGYVSHNYIGVHSHSFGYPASAEHEILMLE